MAAVQCRVRPLTSNVGHTYDDLESALAATSYSPDDEPVVEWDGVECLAALDLDFFEPLSNEDCFQKTLIHPLAHKWWRTHGGGLRLIYQDGEGYTAAEWAALACIQITGYHRAELLSHTRHPHYPRISSKPAPGNIEVHHCKQTFDASAVKTFSYGRQVDRVDVNAWLEANNMQIGHRYSHDRCPCNPLAAKGRDPVQVNTDGIFCYACGNEGLSMSNNAKAKAGWFPWSSIVGKSDLTNIGMMVENLTHWHHAKFVLTHLTKLPETIARPLYSAALKSHHYGTDYAGLVSSAMYSGERIIRFDGYWGTPDGEAYRERTVATILSDLPATMTPKKSKDGEVSYATDRRKIAYLDQDCSLAAKGYPSLTPIRGCRIGTDLNPPARSDWFPISIYPDYLRRSTNRPRRKEGDLSRAWDDLENVFPGINRNLVYLLIAARGIVEIDPGDVTPTIFISGPASTGKSMTPRIAAGICGDVASEVIWSQDEHRFRQAIFDAKRNGEFVVMNEFLKSANVQGRKLDPREALNWLLSTTPSSTSHQLYKGPIRFGKMPVFVITDTTIPWELATDDQIARRITHVPLRRRIGWGSSAVTTGISDPQHVRLISPGIAESCDVILYHVIDTYLSEGKSFFEISNDIAQYSLTHSTASRDRTTNLRDLYLAWKDTQILCQSGCRCSACRRWGKGFKIANEPSQFAENSQLTEMLQTYNPDWHWTMESKRFIEAADWLKITGLEIDARIECVGKTVYLRFLEDGKNESD